MDNFVFICSRFGKYIIFVKEEILRVIAKKTLRDFWKKHAVCEQALKSWHQEITKVSWQSVNELKNDFPSVSILNNGRYVFNIKGNNYRLVVKINFEFQLVWIRFVGTHAEYDKINANEI